VAWVEDLRLAQGLSPSVVTPAQAELDEDSDFRAAADAHRERLLGAAEVVGDRAGGVGGGGGVVAELPVVHHRGEDAGLVPGRPVQPVGELLAAQAAQTRLGYVGWLVVYGVADLLDRDAVAAQDRDCGVAAFVGAPVALSEYSIALRGIPLSLRSRPPIMDNCRTKEISKNQKECVTDYICRCDMHEHPDN